MTAREAQVMLDLVTLIEDVASRCDDASVREVEELRSSIRNILDCGATWALISTAKEVAEL